MTEKAIELLTQLVWNEIGEELRKELEIQGSQLYFADDWTDYGFTRITGDQQMRVDQKRQLSKAIVNRHLN